MVTEKASGKQLRATGHHLMHRALKDLSHGDLVLVACSGGADSLALAAMLARYTTPLENSSSPVRRPQVRAGAVVVDHQMQSGSAQVAARVAQQCSDLGLDPVEVVAVQVTGPGGPEAAARAARYAALDEVATRSGAAAVLLGHTLDDQAEGVLLGLARGSGAKSLRGMEVGSGRWRRPLLTQRRSFTEDYCRAAGLDFWEDPTNFLRGQDDPLRTQVRHRVLPMLQEVLGDRVIDALGRTADLARRDEEALAGWAAMALSRNPDLDCTQLADLPLAVLTRVLRLAALSAGAAGGELSRLHLDDCARLVTDFHGQGPLQLPGGIKLSRQSGKLVFSPLQTPDGKEPKR